MIRFTIASLFFLCLFLPRAQAQTPGDRPNIIYIMGDDHTAQAWGLYGGILKDYVQNRNLKRLAAKGALLDHVFCTNSICVPSRATVITGEYSNRNGVYTLSDTLAHGFPNIARELHKAGYQTAIFGKWHLETMPEGFDTFAILPGQGVYHNPVFLTRSNWYDKNKQPEQGFVDDITTARSINWIEHRDASRPFFLMCHFKSTHEPFDFAERFKNLYQGVEFPYPPGFDDSGAVTTGRSFRGQLLEILGGRYEQASKGSFWTSYPDLPFSTEGLSPLEARKKIYQKLLHDFLRCAAGVDDNLGKLLDYLEKTGLDKNTVIIYTADQGYFLGEHDFFDKRMMYEESLRMPFVICYPKEIKGGTRLHDMVLNIDFAALMADYAGIPKPAFIQGQSFRKNLEGHTPANWRKDMYYRYWQHSPERPAHFGIRNERYKLILFYGQPLGHRGTSDISTPPAWEFYDLQKDPHESHNAYYDPAYANIIREMKKRLLELKKQAGDSDAAYPAMTWILKNNW